MGAIGYGAWLGGTGNLFAGVAQQQELAALNDEVVIAATTGRLMFSGQHPLGPSVHRQRVAGVTHVLPTA